MLQLWAYNSYVVQGWWESDLTMDWQIFICLV
uniref:Uncharacterized protein n=1 Tax=Rhizophora mucronata TaxID=61149 RepID=A0A2P2PQV0_RHIMU